MIIVQDYGHHASLLHTGLLDIHPECLSLIPHHLPRSSQRLDPHLERHVPAAKSKSVYHLRIHHLNPLLVVLKHLLVLLTGLFYDIPLIHPFYLPLPLDKILEVLREVLLAHGRNRLSRFRVDGLDTISNIA